MTINTTWDANKVNGHANAGVFLGKKLDYYTLSVPQADADLTNAAILDKVVEVVSLNGQPVILGSVTVANSNCALQFAIEHTGSWTNATTLQDSLQTNALGYGTFVNAVVTISQVFP